MKVLSKMRNAEIWQKVKSDLCERKPGCKLEVNRAPLLHTEWIESAEGWNVRWKPQEVLGKDLPTQEVAAREQNLTNTLWLLINGAFHRKSKNEWNADILKPPLWEMGQQPWQLKTHLQQQSPITAKFWILTLYSQGVKPFIAFLHSLDRKKGLQKKWTIFQY